MSDTPTFNLAIVEAALQTRFDPLRNFNPRLLTRALDAFRAGRLRDLSLVIDAQEERDDVLACVVPKAKAAVARHGWEIGVNERVPSGMERDAERQKEVLEHFYNQLRVTNALDQDEVGGVSLLLRQMMDAKSKRYAVHNIVWKPGALPTATLWFTPLWFFENSKGRMRFIESAWGHDGVAMEPAEWLVTKGLGVGIACAVAWTFKHMSLRDWVLYNSRCGMPGFEGITDAAPGSPQWENMVSAVTRAASEFRWVRNRTEEIKTIDFGSKGELPFAPLVERMDRALSALWRGADLSTMSAGAGAGQGASLQGEESDMLEQDDGQWLSETLQLKLDRLVLDYVFGPEAPTLACFMVRAQQPQTLELDLKVDEFLVRHGHPVSRRQAAERYSRPLPDDGDELLAAPAAPAPVAGFGFGARTAANEAVGRDGIFKAEAAAAELAARRPVFRPLAARLAAMVAAIDNPEALRALAGQSRAEAAKLYRDVIRQAPDLAKPAEAALGAAMASGMAEQARSLAQS